MSVRATPTAWTTGTTEVFKTGTWRACCRSVARPSPCQQACPVNGDIAEWIGHARAGDLRRAWEVLVAHNPFPAIAGRICHHPARARATGPPGTRRCRCAGWSARPATPRSPPAGPCPRRARNARAMSPSSAAAPRDFGRVPAAPPRLAREPVRRRPRLGGLMRYGIPGYRLARECSTPRSTASWRWACRCIATRRWRPANWSGCGRRTTPCTSPRAPRSPRPCRNWRAAPWLMQGSDYLRALAEGEMPPDAACWWSAAAARRWTSRAAPAAPVARSDRWRWSRAAHMPAQREEVLEALEEGVALHDGAMVLGTVGPPGGRRAGVRARPLRGGGRSRRRATVPGSQVHARGRRRAAIGQDADLSACSRSRRQQGVLAVDAAAGHRRPACGPAATSPAGRASSPRRSAWASAPRSTSTARCAATTRSSRAGGATALDEIATWYHPHGRRAAALRAVPVAERLAGSAEVQLPLTDRKCTPRRALLLLRHLHPLRQLLPALPRSRHHPRGRRLCRAGRLLQGLRHLRARNAPPDPCCCARRLR